jgi:HD-GYP domain-containing protein (c-di-GMP phosphodiesterase class II)
MVAHRLSGGVGLDLRAKTALTLGTCVIALVSVLYWVLGARNTAEFMQLEREDMQRNLKRAVNAIRADLDALETLTLDWAVWDAAHDFLLGRNPAFEDASLNPTALGLIRVERIVMQDNFGIMQAGRERTPVGNYQSLSGFHSDFTDINRWLWKRNAQFIVTGGLIVLDGKLFYVTSSPVIPSSKIRPPSGRLTMSRALDETAISRLAEITQLQFNIYTGDRSKLDAESLEAVKELDAGATESIRILNEEQAVGFRLISDPQKEPPLYVRAVFPREIYREGQEANQRLLVSLVASGLAFFALAMLLLELGLLNRLTLLARELAGIAATGEVASRVGVRGRDELARVAQHVNNGLERIQQTQERSLRFETELERVKRLELEVLVGERTAALGATQLEMFERLAMVAEFRDDETGQHTQRVGEMAAAIGERLGLPDDDVKRLRFAARLHDIGKIAIPDSVLLKPGKLTDSEWQLMKTHAAVGAQMLEYSSSPVLKMACELALTHHERWDGKGYPSGMSGEDIPLTGRIVAVADVVDALLSPRPYKPAWTLADTIEEIRSGSGNRFDPRVVQAFLMVIEGDPENKLTNPA